MSKSEQDTRQATMTERPTRDDLETAYGTALSPYFDEDCIRASFDSHKGEFDIEFGNFSDGLVFNVCAFSTDHSPDDFKPATNLDVVDEGDDFVVFRPSGETAPELVTETLEIVSRIDARLTDITPRNIENLPEWWPEILTP